MRARKTVLVLVAVVVGGAGLILLGRLTVRTAPAHLTQVERTDAYFAGLQAGEAQGLREGRVLQEADALPAGSRRPVRVAFNAGYTAGANDAFAGYDGGWTYGAPYVVTLTGGRGQIVYRIKTREPMKPNVNYYLCANGRDLCQQPRR